MGGMGSAERDPRIVAEFKQRQRRQLLVSLPLVALVFVVLWAGQHGQSMSGGCPIPAAPAFTILIALILFSVKNWRCPACN